MSLPAEILAYVLEFLEFQQLLLCRAVCSHFKLLIDSLPDFQYKIELAIAGQEDGVHHSLSTRRKLLQSNQHNWNTLHWVQDRRINVFHGGLWELYGNVLAQNTADRHTLHFKQLPSQSRAVEEKNWTVDVSQFRVRDFGIDPAQDLLIIIEQPHGVPLGNYHVHLRALSTGEPHPLASGSQILAHERFWGDDISYSILTCGDALAIMFESISVEVTVILWNWKTGQVLMNIVSDAITSVAFLSERYLMFGIIHLDDIDEETEPSLVVVDFTAETPGLRRRDLDTMENTFTFYFPRLAENVTVEDIRIRSDPAPIWTPDPKLAVPFFTARYNRLYVIALDMGDDIFSRTVLLYAHGNTFLSLIQQADGQKNKQFDWNMWGPDGSRMMIPPFIHSSTWVCYVYGTRYVSSRKSAQTTCVYLYDFNQRALKWSNQNGGTRVSDMNNAVDDTGMEGRLVCVTAPTRFSAGEIFQEEVETRLGYRMGEWKVPEELIELDAMCNEDGLVLVQTAAVGEGESYRILSV